VEGIFRDQAGIAPICIKAASNAALDRTIEAQRADARGGMASDRNCKQVGGVRMAVLGVDHDHVRLWHIGVVVSGVGAGVIDVVRHPCKARGPVDLDMPTTKRDPS
jgi:hypothetical protein